MKITPTAARTLGALMFCVLTPAQSDPAWWTATDTKIFTGTYQNHSNWAPANVGQLKHVATQAKLHLNLALSARGNGAGAEIESLCSQFSNTGNYSALNIGQLKNVAKPYYDRLAAIRYNYETGQGGTPSAAYPWDLNTIGDNHSPANLGQLKYIFSFELTAAFLSADTDGDSIPDWLEWDLVNLDLDDEYASPFDITATGDFDNDGLYNAIEITRGSRLDKVDTDGDGYSDGLEEQSGSNILLSSSIPGASVDPDSVPLFVGPSPNEARIVFESRGAWSTSDFANNGNTSQLVQTQTKVFGTNAPFNGTNWTPHDWLFYNGVQNPDYITAGGLRGLLAAYAPFKNRWEEMNEPGWQPPSQQSYSEALGLRSYALKFSISSPTPGVGYDSGYLQKFIRAERNVASATDSTESLAWVDVRMHLPSLPPRNGPPLLIGSSIAQRVVVEADVRRRNYRIPPGQRVSRADVVEAKLPIEALDSFDETYKLPISPQFRRHNVRFTHLTGSTNRRVQANGRPAPAGKPQTEGDSDSASEQLYVDALTRSLDHYTSDVFVPLGASELSLAVTRRLGQPHWNLSAHAEPNSTELIVKHRMDEPFGPGWSSNLCAIATVDSRSEFIDQRRIRAVDADGQTLEFIGPYHHSEPSDPLLNFFVPIPSGLPDENTFQHSVSFSDDPSTSSIVDDEEIMTIRKKHGGSLVYRAIPDYATNDFVKGLVRDHLNNDPNETLPTTLSELCGYGPGKALYRLVNITNANFDHVEYTYAEPSAIHPNPLIPAEIKNGRHPNTKLVITQVGLATLQGNLALGGLVSSVTDPLGNVVNYAYGSQVYGDKVSGDLGPALVYDYSTAIQDGFTLRNRFLSSASQLVANPIAGARKEFLSRYHYTANLEFDNEEPSIIRHFCMHKLIDGEDRTWRIYYAIDISKRSQSQLYPTEESMRAALGAFSLTERQTRDIISKLRTAIPKKIVKLTGEPMVVAHIVLPGGPAVTSDMYWKQPGIASFSTVPVNGDVSGYRLTPKAGLSQADIQNQEWPWNFSCSITTRVRDAEGHVTEYAFGDAAVAPGQSGAFLASTMPLPRINPGDDIHETVLVGLTHMKISYLTDASVALGSESFEFNPVAGMALKKVTDFCGNIVEYEHNDSVSLPSHLQAFYDSGVLGGQVNGQPYRILKHDDPTKETRFGAASSLPNRIKSFTYNPEYRTLSTEYNQATDTTTQYEYEVFDLPPGQADQVTKLLKRQTVFSGTVAGTKLKESKWRYLGINGNFPAFNDELRVWTGGATAGVDATELITTYEATPDGRVKSELVTAPNYSGGTTTLKTAYEYDANGNKTLVQHPRHFTETVPPNDTPRHLQSFRYDGRNRLIEVTKPGYTYTFSGGGSQIMAAEVTQFWYYKDSRKEKTKDPLNAYTWYDYDSVGRLTKTTQDLASLGTKGLRSSDIVTETWFDWTNNPITSIDPLGVGTVKAYDEMGRLIRTTRGAGVGSNPQFNSTAPFPTYTDHYLYTTDGANKGNCGALAFDSSGFKPVRILVDRGGGITDTTTFAYDCFYREISKTLVHSNGQGGTSSFTTSNQFWDQSGGTQPTGVKPTGAVAATTKSDDLNGSVCSWFDSAGREICTDLSESAGSFATKQRVLKYYTGFDAVYKTESYGTSGGAKVATTKFDEAGRAYKSTSPAVAFYQKGVENPFSWTTGNASVIVRSWYDAGGNVVKVGDARSGSADSPTLFTSKEYDGSNRLRQTTPPSEVDGSNGGSIGSPRVQHHYDLNGNLTKVVDPYGKETLTVYDAANRATSVTQPAVDVSLISTAPPSVNATLTPNQPLTTTTTYSKSGHVLTVVDPNGKTTTNVYDALGRLWKSTDPNGSIVYSTHDGAGNRLSVIDGLGQETTFAYDGLARLTRMKPPGKPSILTAYDDVLPEISSTQTTGRSFTIKTVYDARHRVKTVEHGAPLSAAENLTYTYDPFGNLSSVFRTLDPDGITKVTYAYDALNRVNEEWSCGAKHTYQYDKGGNRTAVNLNTTNTQGGFRTLRTEFDKLNRPIEIEEYFAGAKLRITSYEYDLASRPSGVLHSKIVSGVQHSVLYERKMYDAAGRLVQQISYPGRSSIGVGLPPSSRTLIYWRDKNGNLRAQKETIGAGPTRSTLNGYDNGSRLVQETIDVGNSPTTQKYTLYQYDVAGNRKQRSTLTGATPDSTETYNYDAFNELLSVTSSTLPALTYTYDNDGNRLTKSVGGALAANYVYDRFNRLVEVRNGANTIITDSYTYDYRTRRILRQDGGQNAAQATVVSFAGGTSVAEFIRDPDQNLPLVNPFPASTIAPTVQYVRGSDMGGGVGGLLYSLRFIAGGWTPSINSFNARGDLIGQTNASGSSTFSATYKADGKWTLTGGTAPSDRQRANTKEEDPTGFLNEGFRYRDIETGVFISRDPAGFIDGPNLYTYVRQNPWTMFDPDGLAKKKARFTAAQKLARDTRDTVNGNYVRIAWNAVPGETYHFTDDLAQKYPAGVFINKKGYPQFPDDLVEYRGTKIEGMKGDDSDFVKANRKVGLTETPKDKTWHHNENGTMELVPTDMHRAIPHTGGAAIARSAQEIAISTATNVASLIMPNSVDALTNGGGVKGVAKGVANDVAENYAPVLTELGDKDNQRAIANLGLPEDDPISDRHLDTSREQKEFWKNLGSAIKAGIDYLKSD